MPCCNTISVCPSFCVCHVTVVCENECTYCQIFLTICITLVLSRSSAVTKFQRKPFSMGNKCRGWENFANFDRNCCLSRKQYEISPWEWITNRKSYIRVCSYDLEWSWKAGSEVRGQTCLTLPSTSTCQLWCNRAITIYRPSTTYIGAEDETRTDASLVSLVS